MMQSVFIGLSVSDAHMTQEAAQVSPSGFGDRSGKVALLLRNKGPEASSAGTGQLYFAAFLSASALLVSSQVRSGSLILPK